MAAGSAARDGPATRARIVETVESHGALHKSAIAEETGLGWGTVTYHLRLLEDAGTVATFRDGRRTIIHSPSIGPEQVHWLLALSRPETKDLVTTLEQEPGLDARRLGERLDASPRTVRRHLAHLEEVGMVHRDAPGSDRFSAEPGVLERARDHAWGAWRRLGGRWKRKDHE